MNQSQMAFSGILPEGDQGSLPLDTLDTASSARSFVHEHDDRVEIYCARAAVKMLPGEAFEAVLGRNINNYNEQCEGCSNQCFG